MGGRVAGGKGVAHDLAGDVNADGRAPSRPGSPGRSWCRWRRGTRGLGLVGPDQPTTLPLLLIALATET